MKKTRYYIGLIAFLLFGLSGCEQELLEQTNPNAITTSSFWQSEADFELALNAVYSSLQFPTVSGSGLTANMLRSDEAGTESWYGIDLSYTNLTWNDASSIVTDRWSQLYIGVFRSNQVLKYIETAAIPGFSDAEKTSIKAQVRFIRAFDYFMLAQNYNGAVIHGSLAENDADLNKPFSPKDKVITEMVIPDLLYAYQNLPKTWSGKGNEGRITWGAAAAMLGRTYLYQKDWNNAAKYLKEVIDEADINGLYRLTPNFMSNFTLEGEFNSESIFEVAFSDKYSPGVNGNNTDPIWGNPGSEGMSIANAFASITGAGGYNTVLPTYWLQELFVAGDSMDVANPINLGKKYSTRTYATLAVERGDGLYYNAPLVTDPVTGTKSKANFSYGQGSKVKKWTNWYWKDSEDPSTSARSGINWRHIRLADVYLMYAEALLEKNGESGVNEAITYIDKVRDRAGVLSLKKYMAANGGQIPVLDKSKFANKTRTFTAVNKASVMNHLRMVERPLELAFEGNRWFDLVRWGIVKATFTERRAEELKIVSRLCSTGTTINASTQPKIYPLYLNERVRLDWIIPAANYAPEKHDYFPIPSIEVQSNKNLFK